MTKLEELKAAYAAACLAVDTDRAVAVAAAQATYDAEYAATYEELISARKAADVAFNAARVAAVLAHTAAYDAYHAAGDCPLPAELKKQG